jgi:hypothetical protein
VALLAIEKAGMDLATLMPPAPEGEIRAALPGLFTLRPDQRDETHRANWAWPASGATNEFLRARFSTSRDLTPEELAGVDALAEAYATDVRAAADVYFDALDQAMAEKVAGGEVQLSPYISWPQTEELSDMNNYFRATTKIGGGWVMRMGLERGRFPEVLAGRKGANQAAADRDADVRALIRGIE